MSIEHFFSKQVLNNLVPKTKQYVSGIASKPNNKQANLNIINASCYQINA